MMVREMWRLCQCPGHEATAAPSGADAVAPEPVDGHRDVHQTAVRLLPIHKLGAIRAELSAQRSMA